MSNAGNAELLRARDAKRESVSYRRITSLFDEGSFQEVEGYSRSGEEYTEAAAGYGTIEGCPAYAFVQNSDIAGGAMSKAQAAKISRVYSMAVKTGAPIIGIYDSVGGRLKEGAHLLEAYGEILLHSNNLSGVVPQISLILGPCIGTTAMVAAGADIVVMTEKAELTIATDGTGASSEEAAKRGDCHVVVPDEQSAIETARRLIAVLPSNNLSVGSILNIQNTGSPSEPAEGADGRQVIEAVCDADSFMELGKRFGSSAVTGLCEIGGSAAGAVALGGVLDADACAKTARFVRFCDAFSLPIVTFVDAEAFSSLREASKLSSAYSETTAPKLAVVTGTACGPVYIAAAGRGANSDFTFAWPNAVISPLAPETAAVFLWSDRLSGSEQPVEDRKKLIEEYKATEASPFKAAADGFIEDIILPQETRSKIISTLEMLSGKRVSGLPKKHSNIQM
jgi:Acetyl-CoA carboxylase, carboxyltransferase component (subunits alpha and beta)